MAVTLKEIAEKTGFSLSTVSHAISGRNPGKRALSVDTVNKVRTVAQTLGYRPNLLATGLAQKRTFSVGVLVALLRGDFYERVLEGITETMQPEFTPLLAVHSYDAQREKRELEIFIGKRVDGVLAAYSGDPENIKLYREMVNTYHIPLVLVDRGIAGLDCPVVRGDHYQTSHLAASELIKLGHKRIIFATAGNRVESTQLFKDGYITACREAGLKQHILHETGAVWGKDVTKRLASRIVDEVRNTKPAPTAVICQVDWLAYEVLSECRRRNIDVPGELSVMGLQDCEPSSLETISLSAIRSSFEDVGSKSAQLLLEMVEGNAPSRKLILIEPTVVLRSTTRAI